MVSEPERLTVYAVGQREAAHVVGEGAGLLEGRGSGDGGG